jgi:hypothetical protein
MEECEANVTKCFSVGCWRGIFFRVMDSMFIRKSCCWGGEREKEPLVFYRSRGIGTEPGEGILHQSLECRVPITRFPSCPTSSSWQQ